MSNALIKTARHSLEKRNRRDLLSQLGAGRDGNMRDQFEGWMVEETNERNNFMG